LRPLVWFRSDLRVEDQPALWTACRRAERGVVAVFAACPRQWREEHDWGDVKADYLLRGLRALRTELDGLEIPLLFAQTPDFDDVPELLLELAQRHDCDAVYWNAELEVNERRRDRAVAEAFREAGLGVEIFHDQTLTEPGRVLTGQGDFYKVFTPFYRSWKAHLERAGLPELLGRPKRQGEKVCESDPLPEAFDGFEPGASDAELWPAGETRARERLENFLDGTASEYPERRDLPAEGGTSRLSAALALGALSCRQALIRAWLANDGELEGGDEGIAAWIRQLAWRDFYRHILIGYPRVSKHRAFQLETEAVEWRDDPEGFRAWCEGRTGVPIVDAGMRQLRETGWMHNRLRMVTAMFLTKDLLIDWREGERHFMRHLVDGDLANNNGGWQWAASTGTDAAPYFRVMNPWTQAQRFDAGGEFIRRFVPELADVPTAALHSPAKLERVRRERGLDYPAPIVDHKSAREQAIAAFQAIK